MNASALLKCGLFLEYITLGWNVVGVGLWWADPFAGLVIVYYGIREGLHAFHESSTV